RGHRPDGRSRPAAQRTCPPDLAVPARPPDRRLRRPAQALSRLTRQGALALQVRAARDGDIQAITAIYAAELRGHVNTCEYEPPDEAEMVRRMRELRSAGHPYLVAEQDGRVMGYAYTSAFRGRAGYRFT